VADFYINNINVTEYMWRLPFHAHVENRIISLRKGYVLLKLV
jgi:hypothetical protein